MKGKIYSLFFLLTLFACDNSSIERVEVNPPPDVTVSRAEIDNFVNRVFVNLLGREPLVSEKYRFSSRLSSDNFNIASKSEFIDSIVNFPEYNLNIYKSQREYLLNFIFHPSFLPQTLEIWRKLPRSPESLAEISRLELIAAIPVDLNSGKLELEGLQRRLTHNSFYDFVNMGTENFVVSCFENFLLRFPTKFELEQGKKMVDGNAATLFGKSGSSKNQFLDIIFNSMSYSEGQVRLLFRQYLYRETTAIELASFSLSYHLEKKFRDIQKAILIMDENYQNSKEGTEK